MKGPQTPLGRLLKVIAGQRCRAMFYRHNRALTVMTETRIHMKF